MHKSRREADEDIRRVLELIAAVSRTLLARHHLPDDPEVVEARWGLLATYHADLVRLKDHEARRTD